MNKSLIYLLLFLPLFALSACSDAERFDTEQQQPSSRQALTLSVFASDFATYSDGALDTRATNNGNTITFASGDRVGVIITDASGNLSADNIPYKYNGTGWAFDAANNEGKTPCYYDNKATTYIVYYPYSSKADGIKTADDLKRIFPPLPNQSTEADYSASDLLLGVETSTVPLTSLSATLTHAYASVSLTLGVKFTLEDKANTVFDYSSFISNVSFAIGDDIFVARKATDGSYCCIFPASTSNVDIRYVYTYIDEAGIGKIFRGTLAASSATAANTRYTSTSTYSKTYTFADAKLGDFYCKDDADKAYLIPGDFTLTTEQQTACLGIVYWVGDITGDNYGLLSSKFPGGTHGLVACKQVLTDPDATNKQTMYWTYRGDNSVNAWLKNATWTGSTRPTNFISIQVDNTMQGYANTVALQEYNKAMESSSSSSERVKPIYALATFAQSNQAPTSSSGWYWPSFNELKMMCWEQGNTGGIAGRETLNKQFQKVDGQLFSASPWWVYWSSTESIEGDRARGVDFDKGNASGGIKGHTDPEHLVRPVLAF